MNKVFYNTYMGIGTTKQQRPARRHLNEHKAESFDSLCSNRSRVVQLQVAPRGLRTAKVVKDKSEASTAPAAISRR